MNTWHLSIGLLVLSAVVLSAGEVSAPGKKPAVENTSGINIQTDVVYGRTGNVDLKLDLAIPPGEGPFPLVVCVHGGGWSSGSKNSFGPMMRTLAGRGYVAASLGYRLAPAHKLPAQIEDVKCAVRFLRAHAQEYKIIKEKVGAVGGSAGGHLALMLGLTEAKDGLEGDGGWASESSKVQAVVNLFGPTDCRVATDNQAAIRIASTALGTKDPNSPEAARASPVVYIDKNDPPILTFHGSKDPLVEPQQATILHEALRKAGVSERLVMIEGAGHGFVGDDLSRVTRETFAFFDKQLKGVDAPAGASGASGPSGSKKPDVPAVTNSDDVKEQVKAHDKNGDSHLDETELGALLTAQGYPASFSKKIMSRLDKNKDKKISDTELAELSKQFGL